MGAAEAGAGGVEEKAKSPADGFPDGEAFSQMAGESLALAGGLGHFRRPFL